MTAYASAGYVLDSAWRALLSDVGVHTGNVLRRAELPDDVLQQPSIRVTSAEYYRFWRALESELSDPLLPIRLCRAVRLGSFSPPLFAALCSPNWLVAVQRIAHYKRLIAPMRLELTEEHGLTHLDVLWCDAPETPPDSLVMTELLFFVSLLRMGTHEPLRPIAVATTAPPSSHDAFTSFLGVRMQRARAHRITLHSADAHRPFLTSNDALWRTFEPGLRQRLSELDAHATLSARVRAALLEGLPSGRHAVSHVARALAMSARTLQRRLQDDGTSFQEILDDTREELARHYLAHTTLTPLEISFLLGLSEPTSFYRAVRRWTGSTPHQLRHRREAIACP